MAQARLEPTSVTQDEPEEEIPMGLDGFDDLEFDPHDTDNMLPDGLVAA